jgi:hypothetical protein
MLSFYEGPGISEAVLFSGSLISDTISFTKDERRGLRVVAEFFFLNIYINKIPIEDNKIAFFIGYHLCLLG